MGVSMEKQQDFTQEAKKVLDAMNLKKIPLDEELSSIRVERGSIDIEVYEAEKIEKVVLCTIKLHETGVLEASVLVWPEEGYDLPIFWCNLTQVPTIMNVPIFDFIPLLDIVVWPEYAERYMPGLGDLKIKALEILGDTVLDKATDLPSLVAYALSPYKIVANITEDGVTRIPQIAQAYIEEYLMHWKKADPLPAGPEREFSIRKKASTRKLMKGNDPGYPFMIDVFGEERTHKVFDVVF